VHIIAYQYTLIIMRAALVKAPEAVTLMCNCNDSSVWSNSHQVFTHETLGGVAKVCG